MSKGLKRQYGLTLVELMVATTLSLVLLAGVLVVFAANKTTYRMQNGLGTLQENGRYAMRQIVNDLQLAGFGGCLSPNLQPRPRVINLVDGSPGYLDDFTNGEFFSGDDDGGSSFDGRAMAGGTDAIEIRGPLRSAVAYVTGEVNAAGNVTVKDDATGVFSANDYLLISDCAGADIFQATNVQLTGGNTAIAHADTGNTQANLSRAFAADAVVTGFATHTYFVADTGRDNGSGQDVTALYRFDGTSAVELVDGVENLQIEYALDTDGNGRIDAFSDADGLSAAQWAEVAAIRIYLLMNSVEAASAVVAPYTYFPAQDTPITPDANDFRLRQEFSSLVSVRNAVQ
jgi:type IV pilus assembly protein PilW